MTFVKYISNSSTLTFQEFASLLKFEFKDCSGATSYLAECCYINSLRNIWGYTGATYEYY